MPCKASFAGRGGRVAALRDARGEMETYLVLVGSAVAFPLLFLPLERLLPAEQRQPRPQLLFNLLYGAGIYTFSLTLLFVLAPLYLLVIAATEAPLMPAFGATAGSVAAQILFAIAFGFVWDVCQYALHRLQHAVPFLWETHRFHHEESALNVSAYPRNHALGVFGVLLFNLPVVAVFGTQAPNIIASVMMFSFWGYFAHANLRLSLGPLTPLLVGPQFHRIHHSILSEHRDKNFANLFPIIDLAFGTYYRPARTEYPPTGTSGERVGNIRGATIQPFIAWWRMLARRAPAPADAIR